MELFYKLLEELLPFQFIHYDFMKNALLAMLIITPLFGILGTMIVNNRLAFFSDALGHSAFTGIAIGIILGLADTNISMIVFAVVFALLLNWIKRRNTVSTDTIISVFSSLGTAVGLVILSRNGKFSEYSSLLVGDILSITPKEIVLLLIIFIVTILFWGFCFNRLHALSINETLAKSKRIPATLMDNCFVVITALIIMLSIRWVGILIINALLILPAASSRNLASDMREYHRFAIEISMFSGILGLIVSYYNNTATGPTIVIVASMVFFLTLVAKPFVK
ncbi:metal ABC transporter permease [Velocimicrobium porci]|uniref:Metal ABC transporter permease n=1 Tax=Velocimicrobium porci TaxID=2606634 RepID=A0A6L5XV28_9FIRM|nr:metal ABC transporter permease [Velocimicrobium porci]MSS62675.1 metal ABC transporter permease [Velocimicrobium porci]